MDKFLFGLVLSSVFMGIVMIDSASAVWALDRFNDPHFFSKRQLLFAVIGLLMCLIVSAIPYWKWQRLSWWMYLAGTAGLVLVLIPGVGLERNGSQSWIGIGAFSIQPSEFAKLGVVFVTAKLLDSVPERLLTVSGLAGLLGLIGLPFALVMLQPDLGTGTVMVGTGMALLFIGGASIRFFLAIIGAGLAGFSLLVAAAPYRLQRIVSYLDPWSDPLNAGFQIIQSLYAVGPGGLFGFGIGESRQKHFYLPEPQNDFIFAILAEETGFFGAFAVLLVFLAIIWRGIVTALYAPDRFSQLVAGGLVSMIGIQVMINVAVVIGLIPVTGITLPFFSYGGSSLVIVLVSCGVLLNISRFKRRI